MNPSIFILVIAGYFLLLFIVSRKSTRKSDSSTFFIANRNASWPLVAYGMIGVAISGITFISVPGQVTTNQFSYFQLVLGIALGLLIVAFVLVPVFYKMQVISIYSYLGNRYGKRTHRTGTIFFLFAQLAAGSIRLYLMAHVLQILIFEQMGLPFWLSVFITLSLIYLYTYRGGIKTVIATDVLQTTFLILALLVTLFTIASSLDLSFMEMYREIDSSNISDTFFWSISDPRNFWKLLLTGILLTVMTNGLDQSVMQKHLTCKSVRESQKNLITLALVLILVNFGFLLLGGGLNLFSQVKGIPIPEKTDDLYPLLAVGHLGDFGAIAFLLGIAAAAYSSADSSLTGLTTSFCIDILRLDKTTEDNRRIRQFVHLVFAMLVFVLILIIDVATSESSLYVFIRSSGFLYGPLLGLFLFGIYTKREVSDRLAFIACLMAPALSLILDIYSEDWFDGYQFGYEILLVNSLMSFIWLYLLSLIRGPKRAISDS